MFGSGRTIGVLLMMGGGLLAAGCMAVAVVSVLMDESGNAGGMVLGSIMSLLLGAPLIGVGAFFYWRGQKELGELATIKEQKTILNMVKAQGQVDINEVVLELKTDTEHVKTLIYDLVGKGLFHGYINWNSGVLYSKQASALQGATKCPHCGGEQQFAGQGIIECRHCGAQIFL